MPHYGGAHRFECTHGKCEMTEQCLECEATKKETSVKIETKTTASFALKAVNPLAFETALNLTQLACKRSNVEYYRSAAVAVTGAHPDDRQCEVKLTCEDADYLVKLLNDLKAAYQLMDVQVGPAPDEAT